MNLYTEHKGQLTGHENIRRYILGGRGVVTLVSPTKERHTYYFSKPRNPSDFPNDIIFVYALHENKRFYVGMIENGKFRCTHNSRFLSDTAIVKGAQYIMRMSQYDFKTPMVLYHEGMCACCGRPLTTPKSIELGVGPRCYKYRIRKAEIEKED